MRHILLAIALAVLPTSTHAQDGAEPLNYVFAGGSNASDVSDLLERRDISGVQILYTWKQLEPEQGTYDFSAIERDLATTEALDRKLWIQLQDRFFLPNARNLPDYILTEPQYEGGLERQITFIAEGEPEGAGWVAKQWVPALRQRFQALISALAEQFDGKIAGINLPETAIDIGEGDSQFDCEGYFNGELENARHASAAFRHSLVVQYINFWPCGWGDDNGYFTRFFAAAEQDGIGLGGPDIVPWRRGQMKNSYPFFHDYRGRLPVVAMAIQEPTLSYTNPDTGKRFTRADFLDFATEYLGVDIIFWSKDSPWLGDGS